MPHCIALNLQLVNILQAIACFILQFHLNGFYQSHSYCICLEPFCHICRVNHQVHLQSSFHVHYPSIIHVNILIDSKISNKFTVELRDFFKIEFKSHWLNVIHRTSTEPLGYSAINRFEIHQVVMKRTHKVDTDLYSLCYSIDLIFHGI